VIAAIAGMGAIDDSAFAGSGCAPPAAKLPICLTGTITSPGVNIATIEKAGDSDPEEFHIGDTIQDWRILEIGPKYVNLAQGEQTITLDLLNRNPVAEAPPPPPPPVEEPRATPTSRLDQGPFRNPKPRITRGERDPTDLPP
jgi:hypothetical protein